MMFLVEIVMPSIMYVLAVFICYNNFMEIRAKKSLGQNFLKNKKVLEKIVEVSDLKKTDLVLEVGPGKGALTKKILETGAKVLVIEKDHRMIPFLEQKFAEQIYAKQLKIFEGDALEINYKELNLKDKNFKVIANLPYYITGKFLSNILSNNIQPEILVLMLQKAVVERIVQHPRVVRGGKKFKQNLLSLSVKVYGEPEFIMPVSAKNFSPVPKVDSAVLKVSEISKDFFIKNKIEEKDFFNFLKAAFSSKRKKMVKNLVEKISDKNSEMESIKVLSLDHRNNKGGPSEELYESKEDKNNDRSSKLSLRKNLEKVFQDLKIDINTRAEDLSWEDFKNIFLELKFTRSMI